MKPELIFALPATYVEQLKEKSKELTPGLYLLPPADEWQPEAENVLFAQRRETLESDNNARQLNPYLIPRTWDPERQVWLYHPYKRVEGSGEAELINKVSAGGGGHVDLIDGNSQTASVVSLAATIRANLEREAGEEFTIVNRSTMQQYGQAAFAGVIITDLASRAIIITNGGVEDRHMGLVVFGQVQYGQEIVYKEKGLVSMGPMTAPELLALPGVVVEPWTRIVLENLTEADMAPPAEPGQIDGSVISVSHFGMWCNEIDFFKTFITRPDSDFVLYEGEELIEAISRILPKHEVNGLMNNCAMGRKIISLVSIAAAHNHGMPMLDLLARTDELHAIIDADPKQSLSGVAPATVDMLSSLLTDLPIISTETLTERLLQEANILMGSPNKMHLLRILSNTFQTEQNRHRRTQQNNAGLSPLGRGGMVPGGQMPSGIPRDVMARLAQQAAG